MTISSTIVDNYKRGTVGEFLKNNIEDNAKISVVSAYFTIYAYKELKDKLESIHSLRFLFGEPTFIKSIDPNKRESRVFRIEDDNLVIPIEKRLEQKSIAKECAKWIEDKVEIKSMKSTRLIHGKMYHILNENGVQKAIVGSSNFTVKGLGFSPKSNIELNVVIDGDRDREDLLNWFDEIWSDKSTITENVKDEVLKYIKQLYKENSPETIYYKTLYHIFEKFLSEQEESKLLDENTGFFQTEIWNKLYDFQKDGVKGAINKILKHNGCIIADSVGLGKTFEALAIIKYFELLNDKVLVICPKKLSNNWLIYRTNDKRNLFINDRFNYDIIFHTDLSRRKGLTVTGTNLETMEWGNYSLIVIDESHNFRNDNKGKRDENGNVKKSRYERLLQDIIQTGVKTKVLLLSATPVNNNLKDLRNQIRLITADNENLILENNQTKNISLIIRNAQREFNEWVKKKKTANCTSKQLLERLDSSFFKLLDELTIARSRRHVQNYYDIHKIGEFPKRLKPISVSPHIDTTKEFPSYEELNKMIVNYQLSLFKPSAYLKSEYKKLYEEANPNSITQFKQETREYYLIGMMKVNLLKRLESSIKSFEITLKRTIDKIEYVQNKINQFKNSNNSSTTLDEDDFSANDYNDDEDIEQFNEKYFVGNKLKYNMEHLDLEKWNLDLEKDKNELNKVHNIAKRITPERDNKLLTLKELIKQKINNPINYFWDTQKQKLIPNKKIIIFTAFADTAYYLYKELKHWTKKELGLDIAVVTGGNKENETTFRPKGYKRFNNFNDILINFSPRSKERDKIDTMPQIGEIDILIATDCISEGQNLQDADFLINYDIHWNPVKIIQRFGRIDRLQSVNKKIQLVNFWPTEDLNKYINLKERVEARMALVDITATTEENPLEPEQLKQLEEDQLKYRDKQLLRLKDEVIDLEDMDENISLSQFTLDDFRIELINYLKRNKEKLENMPLGLYSIVPSIQKDFKDLDIYNKVKSEIKPGVIFCLRQKGDNRENTRINPLHPYFLVYIHEDGKLRYNYIHSKQILEIFRLLCSGKKEAYEKLCDVFNNETNDGEKMEKYTLLLKDSIKAIGRVFRKRNNLNLRNRRDAKVIPDKQQAKDSEQFELITWLVIK